MSNKAFVLSLVTAGSSVFIYSVFFHIPKKFNEKLNIPTKVLKTEFKNAYIYPRNQEHFKRYKDPNTGFLSPESRNFIKDIVPAPLAKFFLWIDKTNVDLAENYISPWSVIRGAYSRNKEIRLKTVQNIVEYDWNEKKNNRKLGKAGQDDVETLREDDSYIEAQYCTLAQSLDFTTLCGVARTHNCDLRLFLPVPSITPSSSDWEIEDEFRQLLTNLPQEDMETCISYFTSTAIGKTNEQKLKRGGLWCFGGNGLNYTRDIVPQEEVELFCLQALAKHSKVEQHCDKMIELGALELLQKISCNRQNNEKIQRNIIRIIANLCLHEKFHPEINKTRWLSYLAKLSKSDQVPLRLEASRALANLDREVMQEKFPDGVYLLYPRHRSKVKPESDVVFIHGLMGGAFYSWRQQDGGSGLEPKTDCWPESWLPIDFPGSRLLCIDYDTNLTEWLGLCPHEKERRSISYRSTVLLDKIMQSGVGDRPIVWVAHSMGGLIIKQMMMDANQNPEKYGKVLKQTKGFVFYGTPHYGAQLANYSRKMRVLLYPSIEVMELSQNSPDLLKLNENLKILSKEREFKVLNFGEAQTTNIGMRIPLHIVPPESADSGIGEFLMVDATHLNICKPQSRHSLLYQQTVDFIRSCLKKKKPPVTNESDNSQELIQIIF